jgi:hypothetical protein
MSDTPETDAYAKADWWTLFRATEHARILERERDDARQKYDDLATEHMLAVNKICNERDEALDAIYNYKLEVEAWELLAQARRERDEARADAARLADILSGLELRTTEELARVERERDEAREALRELWQTADAYIPQIDEEQTTKWHNAMAPHNLAKSEMNCRLRRQDGGHKESF